MSASVPLYTLDTLRTADMPVPKPIVKGLLNEGETILLVGRPKVGKSRLVQQLALDVARGQSLFGYYDIPSACSVLLLDFENKPSGVKARFAAMSEPHDSDNRISIYAPETLAESNVNVTEAGIRTLDRLLAQCNPGVLIIDTWRLFVGGDENESQVIVDALKALSRVRQTRRPLATVLVHHLRKEKSNAPVRLREDPYTWVEAVSGHHALVSHVDACFGLEREMATDGELIVFGGVARNAATSALLLEEDDATLRFALASGEDAARKVMTPAELEIWGHAKSLGRFTFTVLLKASDTTNRKAVSSSLRKAEAHHVLRKEGNNYVVQV
jgi:AAA domain